MLRRDLARTVTQLRVPPDLPMALWVSGIACGPGAAILTLCLPRALAVALDYRPDGCDVPQALARLARLYARCGPRGSHLLSRAGPEAMRAFMRVPAPGARARRAVTTRP